MHRCPAPKQPPERTSRAHAPLRPQAPPARPPLPPFRARCSQFLGFEMFKHPRLQSAEYILRLDDDITFDADAATDLFEDMHRHNISVGWNCIKKQWDKSSAQMDGRIQAYVDRRRAAGLPVQPAFDDLMPNGTWNMRLYAGCVEVWQCPVFGPAPRWGSGVHSWGRRISDPLTTIGGGGGIQLSPARVGLLWCSS